MRVLWTINTLIPDVAKSLGYSSGHAISWIDAMSHQLRNNVDLSLAIACVEKVGSVKKHTLDNITYYILPKNSKKIDYWQDIIDDFHPDVIHAYGTEQAHNYLLLNNHRDIPIIVSLQGILSEYAKHYYAGIDFSTMIKHTRIKDFLLPTGFFSGKEDFRRRSITERKILQLSRYVEGRSTWDYVSMRKINPDAEYYFCPRMIRTPFFDYEWNPDKMRKHSILVHQGNYPIKGLHIALEAITILKDKYPDIKLYVAGQDIFAKQTWKQRLFQNCYVPYVREMIKKLDLMDTIVFTGRLSSNDMASLLSEMNIALMPSAIENSPNSLAEAMIVGTPVVASFVGGNMDMLEHNKEGFLYCYNEPNMMAYYISQLFDNKKKAVDFSKSAMKKARLRHDPNSLENRIIEIYKEVIIKHKQ